MTTCHDDVTTGRHGPMNPLHAWLTASLDDEGRIRDLRILPMPTGREPTPQADISRALLPTVRDTSRGVWELLVTCWGFSDAPVRIRALRQFERLEDATWVPMELARWTAGTSAGRVAA